MSEVQREEGKTVNYAFEAFPKIPRLKREVTITEKIDGTNAQITWVEINSEFALETAQADPFCLGIYDGISDGDSALALYAGSRNRWLTRTADNFGFGNWVMAHGSELLTLGVGRHFGEWYGQGIQSGYDLGEKRFALFNTARWNDLNPNRPACCGVVPVLAHGEDVDDDEVMRSLAEGGSVAVPGYRAPEGIVVWHSASRQYYKRTFAQDGGKWKL